MTLNELAFMVRITEGFGAKGAQFLMNMECAFQSEAKLYIVQDIMDGGDLHFNMMHRTRSKRFGEERVKFYAACCVLGLEELHSLGIIHRDIKPANVLLDGDGYAKLADFGLCGTLDKTGYCKARGGTLSFMSPESRDKSRNGRHGVAHDYFGLGVMIFVLFTCQYPFSKYGNFNTVIQAHLSEMSLEFEEKEKKSGNFTPDPKAIGKVENYSDGNDVARSSTALREAALQLESRALPAHYMLDEAVMAKLPSEDARDLIRSLLIMNEKYRIGSKGGAQQLKKHRFFKTIDWEKLKRREVPPPARPDTSRASVVSGEMDLIKMLMVNDEEVVAKKLPPDVQAHFVDFIYNPYTEEAKLTKPHLQPYSPVPPQEDDSEARQAEGAENAAIESAFDPENVTLNNIPLGGLPSFAGGIEEELIDPRTGNAITSQDPYPSQPFDSSVKEQQTTGGCTPGGSHSSFGAGADVGTPSQTELNNMVLKSLISSGQLSQELVSKVQSELEDSFNSSSGKGLGLSPGSSPMENGVVGGEKATAKVSPLSPHGSGNSGSGGGSSKKRIVPGNNMVNVEDLHAIKEIDAEERETQIG